MKQAFLVGLLATALTGGTALAQTAGGGQGEKKPMPRSGQKSGREAGSDTKAPAGAVSLGSVRVTRKVMADGKPLAPGTYVVRLTPEEAKPEVVGQTANLERWVEFVQGGKVKGREVVSIVPEGEIAQVADGPRPRRGSSRVEMLKGNDYLRVWINKAGTNYLIHLPPA